jgi:hypothetical protein
MSNKIHLSQRNLFAENEQPKDPPNASIAIHAGAAFDVSFDASCEVQPFDNGNDDVIEGEQNKGLETLTGSQFYLAKTAINTPWTSSTKLFEVNDASPPPQHQQGVYREVNDLPAKAFEHASLQPLSGCITYRE